MIRMVLKEVIGEFNLKKKRKMSFHDSELSKFRTKINYICKFLKFPEIPAKNSEIPGNYRREFMEWRIPGIPGNSRTTVTDIKHCAVNPKSR